MANVSQKVEPTGYFRQNITFYLYARISAIAAAKTLYDPPKISEIGLSRRSYTRSASPFFESEYNRLSGCVWQCVGVLAYLLESVVFLTRVTSAKVRVLRQSGAHRLLLVLTSKTLGLLPWARSAWRWHPAGNASQICTYAAQVGLVRLIKGYSPHCNPPTHYHFLRLALLDFFRFFIVSGKGQCLNMIQFSDPDSVGCGAMVRLPLMLQPQLASYLVRLG